MSYPGATPSYLGFTPGHTLVVDVHASQHNAEQTDIIGLSNKVGTGASTPTSGLVLRGNGVGTSAWGQVQASTDLTGVLPQANGGTGTTLATGTGKAVYDTSPTIATPTLSAPLISDFTSANHDHSSASKGGNLGAVTATSLTTNTIAANGANHLALSAGASKLVKTSVLRQDDTTNTYQLGNSVIITGWGVITPGVTSVVTETVNFGVTFLQNPIVVAICGGDAAAATTYGSGGNNIQGSIATKAYSITTTSFIIHMAAAGNYAAGNTVFYQWMAIGEL